jgi:hypothetical protein
MTFPAFAGNTKGCLHRRGQPFVRFVGGGYSESSAPP